jgi:UDP-N-acetylmuramate dehydrogenase
MSWITWFLENQASFTGDFLQNESLAKHTYYKIGGPAKLLLIPRSESDLIWIQNGLKLTQAPFHIIGLGSNLLVSDLGLDAIVIKTSKINSVIEEIDKNEIRVGASVTATSFLRMASQKGWAGLEWMAGIPGNIGGVISMNAGTHLGEAKDSLIGVNVFNFKTGFKTLGIEQLHFEYRKNLFLNPDDMITESFWKVSPSDPEKVRSVIQDTLVRRKATQPLEYPSCGSVFKNPAGKKAWEILDALHLRGHQVGQAQFSEKHPNFIINLKGARATEVWSLIELAKTRAHVELGIELQEEVKYLK